MGKDTRIPWCHDTFNPWWGCTKISSGCANCYAEKFSKRTGFSVWGPGSERRIFGVTNWSKPVRWNTEAQRSGERRRVFCGSMCDVFEERRDLLTPRFHLWEMIAKTPMLDWLLLTKRPENVMQMVPKDWANGMPPNVWVGTTVEDQQAADSRMPYLIEIPAKVLFLSCEPLIGHVNLDSWIRQGSKREALAWVIAGAESGTGNRPMMKDWVRSLRDQCLEASVSFFYKQEMSGRKKIAMPPLDGRQWAQIPTPNSI